MIYILSCETPENGGGIYACDFSSGELGIKKYYPCDRPMYAVKCEKGLCVLLRAPFESDESGYFFIDEELEIATEIKSTKGKVACHLCVDGEDVYTVNYLSGNIVKNGEVVARRKGKSVHPTRQEKPHTHFVGKTPDGFLAVCDLGTDSLCFYDKGLSLISEEKVPAGYGIRHIVFSNDGKYIYAVNELVPSVSVFRYFSGRAELIKTVDIACGNEKANGAAIKISKDGKYLYVSIREENSICVYSVKGEDLEFLQKADCGGDSPRDFGIFGEYIVCCNEKSDLSVLELKDGLFSGETKSCPVKSTLCVL